VYPHVGFPAPAMAFLHEPLKWWDKWLEDVDNDVLDCPMIQAYIEDPLKPSSKVSEVKGRFVGLESYPSKDINYHTYFLNPYRLTQEKRKQSIKITTQHNHGLLAGEWTGAVGLGVSPADQRLEVGLAVVFESEILQEEFDVLG
ncbi:peptidase S15, partial [Campylobacter jejuni]|nr:peptidase S15 [Campylobacter jejuni]